MASYCLWKRLSTAAVAGLASTFITAAFAQTYPTRPITLVVPFPPGGIADGTARVMEPALSAALGQPVIIENRGGSGGNFGVAAVARAAPDGYTLVMTPNSPVVQNPFMFKNYPIKPESDLAPIAMIGEGYIGLVVQKSSPINSVQDVIAAAKAKPGELTFGNIGVGSSHYFAGALLNKMANINIIPVPFQGAGPAMQNLLGGHISMSYGTLSGVLPYVQSGQLKLLAVAESKRVRDLPDIPTMAETVPGVVTSTWEGFFAPAGTPSPIIDRLYEATKKALESPEVQQKLTRIGIVPKLMSPDELKHTVHDDLKFWSHAVETAGLQPQ